MACYDGKPVVKATNQPERSTAGFGFVYFVRNDEIYKVGITDNLLRRLKELKPDEILNSVRCSNYQEIEKKMHAHFKEKGFLKLNILDLIKGLNLNLKINNSDDKKLIDITTFFL